MSQVLNTTGTRWWLGGCVLWGASAALLWLLAPAALPATALDWQPALLPHQPWRLFTAALVHYNLLHLGANLLGLILVAALGWVARVPPLCFQAWALSVPLTHAALLLRPEVLHYGGLSGILHGGAAVVLTYLLLRGERRQKHIAAALSIGLMLKVLLEAPWASALRSVPGWDMAVVPWAHASGAFFGVLCAAVLLARGRVRESATAAPPASSKVMLQTRRSGQKNAR